MPFGRAIHPKKCADLREVNCGAMSGTRVMQKRMYPQFFLSPIVQQEYSLSSVLSGHAIHLVMYHESTGHVAVRLSQHAFFTD